MTASRYDTPPSAATPGSKRKTFFSRFARKACSLLISTQPVRCVCVLLDSLESTWLSNRPPASLQVQQRKARSRLPCGRLLPPHARLAT